MEKYFPNNSNTLNYDSRLTITYGQNAVQICWSSLNFGPITFSNLHLAIVLAISPDPSIHSWLLSHRVSLVDPLCLTYTFIFFSQAVINIYWAYIVEACELQGYRMKSKVVTFQLSLAGVNQAFSLVLLWKMFLLDCEPLRTGNVLIFAPSLS